MTHARGGALAPGGALPGLLLTLLMSLSVVGIVGNAMATAVEPQSSGTRPQLTDTQALDFTVTKYLAQAGTLTGANGAGLVIDNWVPPAVGDVNNFVPTFSVAADGSGSHTTLQAAIDAVPPANASSHRVYIRLQPGTYREMVCVKDKAPITLYSSAADASQVVIVNGNYNGKAKAANVDTANPCNPNLSGTTFGTSGSASVAIYSHDFHAKNISFANDAMQRVVSGVGYPAGASGAGGAQAVALITQGDKLVFENVRVLGHQDSLYVKTLSTSTVARAYFKNSFIQGDVDFIFGRGVLVLDACTIHSLGTRLPVGQATAILAPSTTAHNNYGILVNAGRFTSDTAASVATTYLGRAWDEGVATGTYAANSVPNGQLLVRNSTLGKHIRTQEPWATSTSSRVYSDTGNRFAEYRNQLASKTPDSSDLAPAASRASDAELTTAKLSTQVLANTDGWAAAEKGTRGGADATPEHVFDVHHRAELVAALQRSGATPKIIRLHGRIDLSVDDANRPLVAADYRDPAFDQEAYLQAYAPAVWGKKPLTGPLEEARLRSAANQAARVVVRVPSNTTLIGVGSDARLAHGMLLLDKVDNVILRNVHFSDAYDYFPAWDPMDNANGEWNAEFDNVSLRGATHVWVDHCSFSDGDRPDHTAGTALGRPMQHHDGLLDITQQSNFVTVSYNHFKAHDKTSLIGASDNQTRDADKLKVTFHHNLWEHTKTRSPRVRYGQVHVYNNLYLAATGIPYAHHYSMGVGVQSRIFSENNVWETDSSITASTLTKLWKGSAFFDRGSLLNGQPVDLVSRLRAANPGATLGNDVGWSPTLHGTVEASADVAKTVRASAGAGHL